MASRLISALDRLGDLLDRRGILFLCGVLLAVQMAAALAVAGRALSLGKVASPDFTSFYAAGVLANAGRPALAYERAPHSAAEERAAGPGIQYKYFYYPPVFLLPCALLARLPYWPAFVLFEAATFALLLGVVRAILRERLSAAAVVLLAFPPAIYNLALGQNGFLTAGLLGAATLFFDRRPALAGVLFGALCYKPQFGLLVPVALLSGRHWRALCAAALSVAALVLLSAALFGWGAWSAFFRAAAGAHATYESGFVQFGFFVSPFGAVMAAGGAPALAYAVQATATLTSAALVALIWRRPLPLALRAAALAAAALVAAPIALFYDAMLLLIAGAWLVRYRAENGMAGRDKAMLALLFISLGVFLGLPRAPLMPAAVFAFAALAFSAALRAANASGAAAMIGSDRA